MHSKQMHAKIHKFCDACAKQGITSELVQFSVNFKEAILLCIKQDCLFPFGSGDISSFVVGKITEKTTFSTEPKYARPICSLSKYGQGIREREPRDNKGEIFEYSQFICGAKKKFIRDYRG